MIFNLAMNQANTCVCSFLKIQRPNSVLRNKLCATFDHMRRIVSSVTSGDAVKSRYELFINPAVQELLIKLTKVNPAVTLPDFTKLKRPKEITLMTREQLKKAEELAMQQAIEHIQMPPVLLPRQENDAILSRNPEMKGFTRTNSSFVFVDTTLGIPERERSIVVRTAEGTLKLADWDTRDRMMQAFYPRNGRRVKPASMFYGEHVKYLLAIQRYRQLLDNACSQFEPDHPDYVKVTAQVYQHCESHRSYDKLLSTRHYGPMVFYFVLNKQITNLINHLIAADRVTECLDIIKLYNIIWDKDSGPVPDQSSSAREQIRYLQAFLQAEGMSCEDTEEELKQYAAKQEAIKQSGTQACSEGELGSSSSSSESESSSSSDEDEKKPPI